MLESEFSKEVKKVPVVDYEIPKKIFLEHNTESGLADALLVKLWDFN
jgi:U3 small nucleolar RNA-associated protein 19